MELLSPGFFPTPSRVIPLFALIFPVALLLWPSDRPPMFFFTAPGDAAFRRFLTVEAFFVLASPFSKVTFLRTFIADILCSMPKLLIDITTSVCLYGATCEAEFKGHLGAFLGAFPFCVRLAQSLRAARDAALEGGEEASASQKKNILNAAKYSASILLVAVSFAKSKTTTGDAEFEWLSRAWLILSVGCTLANFTWDVVNDWNLGGLRVDSLDKIAKEASRARAAELAPSQVSRPGSSASLALSTWLGQHPVGRAFPLWVYIGAVPLNALLRFGWAIYVSPNQKVVAEHTVLLLAAAELTRRAVWALLRIEWENSKRIAIVVGQAVPPTLQPVQEGSVEVEVNTTYHYN
eukprot:CAMPEP_0172607616 /NCGR_PEP_ID=MMETSP1068-20121228/27760_1 /TAXON_ID=35684 /ORGANISM="Pseudopedinella elastica, Strain CCMP716" /LENGTH=349 /DNA_ID=CAMNT_0013410663 /DNA_START=353 /DNA_END=1402 /DNA_ORIENTATION=+